MKGFYFTKNFSRFSTITTLTATMSSALLIGLAPKAQAQSAPADETFSITGNVAELCTLTNLDLLATMAYDHTSEVLSTRNTGQGGNSAGFTVECNADPSQVNYEITSAVAPAAFSMNNIGATCALLVNGNTIASVLCDMPTPSTAFAVPDTVPIDGRDSGAPSAETGTVDFEVAGNGTQLTAGNYEYDVVLTWVP